MKKLVIYVIIIVCSVSFGYLVYFGFRHARGVPVDDKEREVPRVSVPLIQRDIHHSKGIDFSFWDTQPSNKIDLLYQLMVLPWPKKVVPEVTVKAFHNTRKIFFYMEWEDKTQDIDHEIGSFTDACAVMFPLGKDEQPSSLMMGFLGKANIWQWRAVQDRKFWLNQMRHRKVYVDFYYPFEEEELFPVSKEVYRSAVNDLLAIRVGTVTPVPEQTVSGRGIYREKKWVVVISRSLTSKDAEVNAAFDSGKRLCSFAVWDGSHGDRGGRKSISNWVELNIE